MEEKLNLEGIHLDMTELIEKYSGKIGSVSDPVEIQQISLFCQQNYNDYRKPVLLDMIKREFAYAGLYPHCINFEELKKVEEKTKKVREAIRLLIEAGYRPLVCGDINELRFAKPKEDEL